MKHLTTLLVAAGLIAQATVAHAQSNPTIYLVADAHFDTQWNWDVQTSISQYVPKTLFSNLTLLERYPEYVFNFEGGIKYYWMKEYFPEAYKFVKKYVQECRWHISGASWDATDPNIPSPESLTRNILYGQHYYMKEFGVQSTDIFLPDCFGFGYHLPTVANHCGLIGFSTQKLQWRKHAFYGEAKEPFSFGKWYGIDGNCIYAALRTGDYTSRFKGEDLSHSKAFAAHAAQTPLNVGMLYYGTGDTGGSPDLASVRSMVKGVNGNGPVKIVSATSDELFKYLKDHNLPVEEYKGELLMDVHGTGCYTSQSVMKLFNRRNEQMADAAEHSAVAADWLGEVEYPREVIETAWKRFIWHQFHDDLTGTSIPRAYEFSWNDEIISQRQFSDVMRTSVTAVSKHLNTMVGGTPLVVYNPLGFERTDIVTLDGVVGRVYDAAGKPVSCQKTSDGKTCFVATVPSLGYAVYSVKKGTAPSKTTMKVTSNTIENSIYKITLDKNGDICSLVDKRNGKQLVADGKSIRLALFTNNESKSWPAWEILKKTIDAEPVAVEGETKINVEDNGPIKASIKVERTFAGSTFVQRICLYEGACADRIDIVNDIDWQSPNSLLKAEFPLSISNKVNRYDLGIGSIERGVNVQTAYEVPAQQWASLTAQDGSYGVSVLNDCKYGWDKPAENMMRLTLLHSPKAGKWALYQQTQDFGHHHFTYSIVGHEGDFRNAGIVKKAEVLNQPMVALATTRHKGELGKTFSFAQPSANVDLRALKIAEDSDAYVVRFYETSGLEAQHAGITFAEPIIYAKELNGNEAVIGPATAIGKDLSFEIGPFGMKTFLVKLDRKKEFSKTTATLALPLNVNAVTFNAFRKEGNFDGEGNTYSAEIFPESIIYNGVSFDMAQPDGATAMRCKGDTISLPEGKWSKLYLLASSAKSDTTATFIVGTLAQEKYVPYYSGFIGQWGNTGRTETYTKDASPAYVGTHRHHYIKRPFENSDLPYEFTYLFFIELDVPADAKQIVLPKAEQVNVFAATVQ